MGISSLGLVGCRFFGERLFMCFVFKVVIFLEECYCFLIRRGEYLCGGRGNL